jgi:hypothetical protein
LEENILAEILSDIETIEKNTVLYEEKNFETRAEIIDFIEFQILEQIEYLIPKASNKAGLHSLKVHAEKVKSTLEGINHNLFLRIRESIRIGECKGAKFKSLIKEYTGFGLEAEPPGEEVGYDNLDYFINGLFQIKNIPEQIKELEPEMVFYQKTPARVIFELVEKVGFTKDDVFFDLGSGLGQVAILVNLLSGISTKGIEYEPAFCQYATDSAAALNLSGVSFINGNARAADYSTGTIFFMFTPFRGEMMQEVLSLLKKESLTRQIKIITYGPCTAEVALESWLYGDMYSEEEAYSLRMFSSI